jgi:hypothetical protein
MDNSNTTTDDMKGDLINTPYSEGLLDGMSSEHDAHVQFVIDNENKANRLLRKLSELRSYRARVDEWAAREKARACHDEQFLLMRYGCQLQAWAAAQIAAQGGRRKSVSLPAGIAGFRHSPARLIVDDEAKVISWAKGDCPDAVRLVEKLSRSTLNNHFQQTGEIPTHGAHLEPECDEFYIR